MSHDTTRVRYGVPFAPFVRFVLFVLFVLFVNPFASVSPSAFAQTPQPFPTPSSPAAPRRQPPPAAPAPAPPATPPAQQPLAAPATDVPNAASLGVPIYPNAVFLASYDAGRGQRYYLFGVTLSYADAVNYYKTALKTKGDELFEAPPTYQFELAKFRDESMAFPPSVTVKDYTWGGSAGYPNPRKGAQPARFPTVIQIVPVPGVP
jgi:hypothetical protein